MVRILAAEHHKEHDSSAPHVHLAIVLLIAEYLRGHAANWAALLAHFAFRIVETGVAEVYQTDVEGLIPTSPILLIDQNVLKLDVSVGNVLRVQMIERVKELDGRGPHLVLGDVLVFTEARRRVTVQVLLAY